MLVFLKDCHAGKAGDPVPNLHPSELKPLISMGFAGEAPKPAPEPEADPEVAPVAKGKSAK